MDQFVNTSKEDKNLWSSGSNKNRNNDSTLANGCFRIVSTLFCGILGFGVTLFIMGIDSDPGIGITLAVAGAVGLICALIGYNLPIIGKIIMAIIPSSG